MVPSDFTQWISVAALGQTGTSQPPVPGAVGAGNGTTATQGAPAAAPPGGGAPANTPTGSNPMSMFWILGLGLMLMILMTSMSGRKQKKQREQMLGSLKRNDKVLTSSGIIGTVADLTDHEMVLRVDEASNTRIRFARSAVQQILRDAKESGRTADVEVKPKLEAAASR